MTLSVQPRTLAAAARDSFTAAAIPTGVPRATMSLPLGGADGSGALYPIDVGLVEYCFNVASTAAMLGPADTVAVLPVVATLG